MATCGSASHTWQYNECGHLGEESRRCADEHTGQGGQVHGTEQGCQVAQHKKGRKGTCYFLANSKKEE